MNFEQALRSAGMHPREIVADGRIRRCGTEAKPRKDNGWYVLHPDGHGVWGDWSVSGQGVMGTWRDEGAQHRAADPQVAERMRERRAQERRDRVAAMRRARAFWHGCSPLSRPHPYIERKGLSPMGCASLRWNPDDGALVVPVWLDQWLISVQKIAADGTKRFWPGAPVKAGCFVLERKHAPITAFVEGLATGLAVYQSVRHARVVVCFDAGNLLAVVERTKPTGSVVIAADNDWGTQARTGVNPGLVKARNAAELIGAGVAYPHGIEGTDFADLLKEHGERGPRAIEALIRAGARYVVPP